MNCANALTKAGAEIHVVKNTVFCVAAKEAGVADLNGALAGQVAVITGQKDISAAAKALKNFAAEFDKLKLKFGYLNNQRLDEASVLVLADLPSLDVLRGKLLGLLNAPATKLATLINTLRPPCWPRSSRPRPKRPNNPISARPQRPGGLLNKPQRKSSVSQAVN